MASWENVDRQQNFSGSYRTGADNPERQQVACLNCDLERQSQSSSSDPEHWEEAETSAACTEECQVVIPRGGQQHTSAVTPSDISQSSDNPKQHSLRHQWQPEWWSWKAEESQSRLLLTLRYSLRIKRVQRASPTKIKYHIPKCRQSLIAI